MPTVHLTLADTPTGGVAIRSSFKPAIGLPCSPAQGHALEIINRTHKQWGDLPAPVPCECDLELTQTELDSGRCSACGKSVLA
jgi:hypothetical protein